MTERRTLGQRWADAATEFSGSWAFIGWFATISALWIAANALHFAQWDPYPFLFLNWLLTVVSTFQSPLILLSQNRQNEVDRERMRQIMRSLEAIQKDLLALNCRSIQRSAPSFNHSRADGPFSPCPECLPNMSREQLLALIDDLMATHGGQP